MKKMFAMFWQGLTGLLTGIINGIATMLGLKESSAYGRCLRRIVGTSLTLIVVLCAAAVAIEFGHEYWGRLKRAMAEKEPNDVQYVSRGLWYCSTGDKGYLVDADDRKVLKGIDWISKPLGYDTLVCYSNGRKRGYFNIFTGKVAIAPRYDHAWTFSEGLAAVDDGGWIKFIDQTGRVVIDSKMPFHEGIADFVFHNGHCVMPNRRLDRVGLIDRQGRWALPPEYFSVEPVDSFWRVSNGRAESLLNARLQTLIPFGPTRILMHDSEILAIMPDHTQRTYNTRGELLEDFCISNMEQLTYATSELHYGTSLSYDDEGNVVCQMENSSPDPVQKVAKDMCYQAEFGWYGLISAEGKIITPPCYTEIEAVGYDLYRCATSDGCNILLNGNGEKVPLQP